MSGLQPANSNTRQVSLWPFWQQRCNGANPPRFFIYALAFHLHRIWTVWLNPFQAASCSAVLPCWKHKKIMWNWISIPVLSHKFRFAKFFASFLYSICCSTDFFFGKYWKSILPHRFFLLLFKVKILVIFVENWIFSRYMVYILQKRTTDQTGGIFYQRFQRRKVVVNFLSKIFLPYTGGFQFPSL